METKEKAGYSVLTIALLLSLGVNVLPDATHFCEAREITYHCDSLSKYYGLENGKCINDIEPNKLCNSGWEEIFKGPQPIVPEPKAYLCNNVECVIKA